MELVDMRGLKPRPRRGPGSTPGMGIFLVPKVLTSFFLSTIYILFNGLCGAEQWGAHRFIWNVLFIYVKPPLFISSSF